MRNFDSTIISQYYSSPIIAQLLTDINAYLDPDANLEAFYTLIWNLNTAEGYGLDVWGRIVGVDRVLQVATGAWFGFAESPDGQPFGQAPFYNGEPTTGNFALTDQAFLLLILAKAATNITDGSIQSINAILMNLFPRRGNAYVIDGPNQPISGTFFGFKEGRWQPFGQGVFGDLAFEQQEGANMTMVFVFDFALQPFEVSIVTASGVLPKPVGVLATYQYTIAS